MPYINTATNVKIDKEKKARLTSELGRAIALIPGKSEEWLMLSFNSEVEMAFRGDTESPAAIFSVEIFGNAKADDLDRLTERLCELSEGILGVSKECTYVKYREVDVWGWNGFNL